MQDYDKALPDKIKQTKQETCERNEFGERKVATHLWRHSNTERKSIDPDPQDYMIKIKKTYKETATYADDLTIKTANIDEI